VGKATFFRIGAWFGIADVQKKTGFPPSRE
jgi:hypothetical protein